MSLGYEPRGGNRLVERVHGEDSGVYGDRKIHAQLHRQGHPVTRWTVRRLMRHVLAHLAIRKGQYAEAVRMLEPAAAQAPLSSAALELGLLQLRLGRAEVASRLLTTVFRQGSRAGDPAVQAALIRLRGRPLPASPVPIAAAPAQAIARGCDSRERQLSAQATSRPPGSDPEPAQAAE